MYKQNEWIPGPIWVSFLWVNCERTPKKVIANRDLNEESDFIIEFYKKVNRKGRMVLRILSELRKQAI